MGHKNTELVSRDDFSKAQALQDVGQRFGINETVTHLKNMMKKVTEKDMNADTVNAACNCVQNLNLTIKTALMAARFLSNK